METKAIMITENKQLVLQAWAQPFTLQLGIKIRWTFRQDHAGFEFTVSLPFLYLEFSIEDVRHWNYEKNRWYIYDEDGTHY